MKETRENSMYKCVLVYKGFTQEYFYREGASAQEVLDGLSMFCWPEGEWDIEEA